MIFYNLKKIKKVKDIIQPNIQKNNLEISQFETILDFGCGCGRVMRKWINLTETELNGCDYNSKLIKWCKRNLPFAIFNTNKLMPPLPYNDQKFDFVYTISVFTHLTEELQKLWLIELARVLRPEGYLIITLHGENRSGDLTPEQKKRSTRG